jgi:Holliday junction DNA helicase RuvB
MYEEEGLDRALRPKTFDNYVGQSDLIKKLKIAIRAANDRNEPLDSVLLIGGPGLGKTTIANIIANESNCNCQATVATAIKSQADIIELLCKIEERDILFIDEIHALDKQIEETLYSALEDYKISIKVNDKIVNVNLAPFCMIGATTLPGKMQAPLRDRFGITHALQLYTIEELSLIIKANINKLNLSCNSGDAIENIAKRSRGIPRVANKLLRRVRDFAQLFNNNRVTEDVVNQSMDLEGVDEQGLTISDYKYLQVLRDTYSNRPVGIQALSATLGQDRVTLENFIEPYLVQLELVARTQNGRELTKKGVEYATEKINQERY